MFFQKKQKPSALNEYIETVNQMYLQLEQHVNAAPAVLPQYREAVALRAVFKTAAKGRIERAKGCIEGDHNKDIKKKISWFSKTLAVPVYLGLAYKLGLTDVMLQTGQALAINAFLQFGLAHMCYSGIRTFSSIGWKAWGDARKPEKMKTEIKTFYDLLKVFNARAKDRVRKLEDAYGAQLLKDAPSLQEEDATLMKAVARYQSRIIREQETLQRKQTAEVHQIYEGTKAAVKAQGKLKLRSPKPSAIVQGSRR